MWIRLILFAALPITEVLSRQNNYTYDRIGDDSYFVGLGHTDWEVFDWFDARQSCWDHHGQLVSVQTEAKMIELQNYIVQMGYANGSTFSTSGNSFNREYPFSWDALKQRLSYPKWLPGEEPRLKSFLSLQLIDDDLYMIRSWGYDQFYICEYESIWQQVWLRINSRFGYMFILISAFFALICLKRLRPKHKKEVPFEKLIVQK